MSKCISVGSKNARATAAMCGGERKTHGDRPQRDIVYRGKEASDQKPVDYHIHMGGGEGTVLKT